MLRSQDMALNIGGNVSFLDNNVEGLKGFYETGELRGQGFSDVRGQRVVAGQPLNSWYLVNFEWIKLKFYSTFPILIIILNSKHYQCKLVV